MDFGPDLLIEAYQVHVRVWVWFRFLDVKVSIWSGPNRIEPNWLLDQTCFCRNWWTLDQTYWLSKAKVSSSSNRSMADQRELVRKRNPAFRRDTTDNPNNDDLIPYWIVQRPLWHSIDIINTISYKRNPIYGYKHK